MNHRLRTRLLPLLLLALATRAAAAPCAGEGVLTIVADNQSDADDAELVVSGERLDAGGACDPAGTDHLQTSYPDTPVTCRGKGPVRCEPHISGLAPGVWVHRVQRVADVGGSSLELWQAQQGVVLANTTMAVSNVVEWTVFGRTFAVTQPTAADLREQLDAARSYTKNNPFPALVLFDPGVLTGAATPTTIALQPPCGLTKCTDRCAAAAYCFEGSHVTVDALDGEGEPGGVVLTIGACPNSSLLRILGSDNTLRGLVLEGSNANPPGLHQADTIVISGPTSGGNRLVECTVRGPTNGDAVAVDGEPEDCGTKSPPGVPAGSAPENTIVATEIKGARDKGVKVDFGGVARVERSCVHDNENGGIQATLDGTVAAVENVIQHNLLVGVDPDGSAENGLLVGVPNPVDSEPADTLTTSGNVIRFSGQQGISVKNNATAMLANDVVAENYRAGLRMQTTVVDRPLTAQVRGGLFACNYAPGLCEDGKEVCRQDADCSLPPCSLGSGEVTGVGVALDEPCAGCSSPAIDLGAGGNDGGRNALTLNTNPQPPSGSGLPGINFSSKLPMATTILAAGNQWQHCEAPPDPVNPEDCNLDQVRMHDVRVNDATLDLGTPIGPRHGPIPVVTTISAPRPRKGDFVRVYGGPFNAIDGTACLSKALPSDPCSPENPDTVTINRGSWGNRVTVTMDGVSYDAEVHQVTPSMLIFRMPVDCDEPGMLTVARGDDVGAAVQLCDPSGCADRPDGALCDDDDVCTSDETCQGGACRGQAVDCATSTSTTSSTSGPSATSSTLSTSPSSTSLRQASTVPTTSTTSTSATSTSSTSTSTTSASSTTSTSLVDGGSGPIGPVLTVSRKWVIQVSCIGSRKSTCTAVVFATFGTSGMTGGQPTPGKQLAKSKRGKIAKSGRVVLKLHLNRRGRALLGAANQLPVLVQTTIIEHGGAARTTTNPALLVRTPKKKPRQ